jgi:hypothetical protein
LPLVTLRQWDERAYCDDEFKQLIVVPYILGTAVKGQKEWPDQYGVKGDYMPDGMLKQQLFPFTHKG